MDDEVQSISILSSKPTNHDEREIDVFYYTFQETDTFLYSLVRPDVADRVTNIIWSKVAVSIYFIFIIIDIVLTMSSTSSSPTEYGEEPDYETRYLTAYVIAYRLLYSFPWAITALMTYNRPAMRLVIGTFDWWFKLSQISLNWAAWIFEGCLIRSSWDHFQLWLTGGIIATLDQILLIQMIASFDALNPKHVSPRWQALMMFVGVFWFSFGSLKFSALIYSEPELHEMVTIHLSPQFAFSSWELQLSTSRNLAIFFGKQFVLKLWREYKGSDNPTSLSYTPDVRWTRSTDKKTASRSSVGEIVPRTRRIFIVSK